MDFKDFYLVNIDKSKVLVKDVFWSRTYVPIGRKPCLLMMKEFNERPEVGSWLMQGASNRNDSLGRDQKQKFKGVSSRHKELESFINETTTSGIMISIHQQAFLLNMSISSHKRLLSLKFWYEIEKSKIFTV